MKVYDDVTKLVGGTPIMRLANIEKKENLGAFLYAKLEYFNPGGSIKDRPVLNMILESEKRGILKKGATIIEATSGSVGIGLASIARRLGYEVVIVMPENMSDERKKVIKAYGAKLVLSEAAKGMAGALEKAEEIRENMKDAVILGQFTNIHNPQAHKQTAKEIFDDIDGKVDIVVAGVGTGGTVTGVGETLKAMKKDISIVAIEPESSAVLSGGSAGKHKIQGIGAGFVPEILNTNIYDEILKIDDESACDTLREVAENEGVLLGISSGAAVAGAVRLAKRQENAKKNIVVICPDTGERYLSML